MKELPIILNTEMVTAILDGRKTQSRRPLKVLPDHECLLGGLRYPDGDKEKDPKGVGMHNGRIVTALQFRGSDTWLTPIKSPFGSPGDLIYVKETTFVYVDSDGLVEYKASSERPERYITVPSIHIPKEHARIWLRVKRVWVERLYDVSEEDAVAEGIKDLGGGWYLDYRPDETIPLHKANESFWSLWDSIYSDRYPCKDNPWVWCCEFEVVSKKGRN